MRREGGETRRREEERKKGLIGTTLRICLLFKQQHRLEDLMVGKGDVKPYINGLALIGLHRELVLQRWLCSKIATTNMLG
jgi:hypothetical protein